MQLHKTCAATLTVLLCAALPAAGQTKRAISLDDQAKERFVRDPELSPDGKWVAYVVSTADLEKDKRNSDLWMVSWDGSQQVQLTSSPDNESSPKWSPDGRYLAFLSSRGDEDDKKKGAQVWLLNRAGGEALKLTDIKGGVSDYAWSPDGKRLVLAVDDFDPNDEPEKKEGWKRKTAPPIVITRYHFKEDAGGYLGAQRTHLGVFDVDKKIFVTLTTGAFDEEEPAWSPDGTQIAFVSNRSPDPDRTTDTNVYVMDAKAGATPRQLTTWNGTDGGRPTWSPDGKFIAYLQGDEQRYYAYSQEKLAIVPAAGGEARVLTTALDRSVRSPEWTPDGKSLLVIVEDDRTDYVGKVPAEGGAVVPLTTGRRVVAGYSQAGSSIAVTSTTSKEPDEVFALDQGGGLRQLSHQNDAWLKDVQLAGAEDITFTAKDGTVVNGLLSIPVGSSGKKLPLILYIHGGPDGQDEHSFEFAREFFAANGYAVLQVNYRGSSGRGSAFQKAIYADWGNKEVVDLLAGVDHVIATGVADPDRLGIGGWSYGGILTNYTIATDPRFKAAVSGASSSLQTTMYGLDQYIKQYDTEMGQPWKNTEVWMKVSYPFFKADRIKTPTLFLCGDKDFNVPIAGVEQMYQALQSLKIDSQLVIYPGQHHGIALPSYQRDRMERFVAWWDKYLKPDVKTTTSTSNSHSPTSKKP
jgi:dipeptidyl aminopeptidase/acylaminoacyl peptidase